MLESDLHVFHAPVEIADLSDLFLLAFEVQLFESLLSLGWFRLNLGAQYRQSHDFHEVHIAF